MVNVTILGFKRELKVSFTERKDAFLKAGETVGVVFGATMVWEEKALACQKEVAKILKETGEDFKITLVTSDVFGEAHDKNGLLSPPFLRVTSANADRRRKVTQILRDQEFHVLEEINLTNDPQIYH
jgi:hypothetical protein